MAEVEQTTHQEEVTKKPEKIPESENVETVVSPDETLLVKHPLQHKWSLWFFNGQLRTENWQDKLIRVSGFDTVEDFWALYNHVKPISRIQPGCDYAVFKDDISPMWEHECNKNGGRWLLALPYTNRVKVFENFWLELLLCLIGESFGEYSDTVCGAVGQIRVKGDKLALWTADSNNKDASLAVGKVFRERIGASQDIKINYMSHQDTQKPYVQQTQLYSV